MLLETELLNIFLDKCDKKVTSLNLAKYDFDFFFFDRDAYRINSRERIRIQSATGLRATCLSLGQ
jgi:hypothetical protein